MLRGHRFLVMWVTALAVLFWYYHTDPDGGTDTLARMQWMAWIFVVAGPVYLLRRALLDGARSREAYRRALEHPIGAGLVFLGLAILTGLLFIAFAGRVNAAELPPGAVKYLPVLAAEQQEHWANMPLRSGPLRSALAAQVDKETCRTKKSPQCWNPHTELKTAREYGFGLGQLTITAKFDNFKEARKLDASLRDWQFADRYDPVRQLRTMILMDRSICQRLEPLVPDEYERLAMCFAGYNGGLGGLLSDRRVCAQTEGCDPGRWFGNVEKTSLKSRVKVAGYGKPFFEINREYVREIMIDRRPPYAAWFGEN